MKKFFYTSLLGAALLVQPVSGSESHSHAVANANAGGKAAYTPLQVAAMHARDSVNTTDMTPLVDRASPERTDWTLLLGALLFIGVVIRRRTAVR